MGIVLAVSFTASSTSCSNLVIVLAAADGGALNRALRQRHLRPLCADRVHRPHLLRAEEREQHHLEAARVRHPDRPERRLLRVTEANYSYRYEQVY